MNNQSAHGIKGLRTFPTQAANVISSVPVCADDDCMQCAMGLHCPNAPKAAAKPRVRVCLAWSVRQLESAMRCAVVNAKIAKLKSQFAATLDAMRGPQAVHMPKPMGTSKSTLARQARYARNCAAMVRS